MRFAQWAVLAAEYAEKFYCWPSMLHDITLNDAMCAFDGGETPVDYVDGLAKKVKLSYCPLNQQEEK